jgi:hypothetical protein
MLLVIFFSFSTCFLFPLGKIRLDHFFSSTTVPLMYRINEFRDYNIMMVGAPGAKQVAERSETMKETYLTTVLSRSL